MMSIASAFFVLIMTMSSNEAIAIVGSRTILHREVACNPQFVASVIAPDQELEDACRTYEENEFHRAVRKELIAMAAREQAIEVTAEDAVPPKWRDPAIIWQMTESDRAVANAALRVIRGEATDTVFAEELAPAVLRRKGLDQISVPRSMFDGLLKIFKTEADVRSRLATISEEGNRRKVEELFIDEARSRALRQVVLRRSREWGVDPDEAQERFWCDLITRTNSRVLDPRYHFPDLKRLV